MRKRSDLEMSNKNGWQLPYVKPEKPCNYSHNKSLCHFIPSSIDHRRICRRMPLLAVYHATNPDSLMSTPSDYTRAALLLYFLHFLRVYAVPQKFESTACKYPHKYLASVQRDPRLFMICLRPPQFPIRVVTANRSKCRKIYQTVFSFQNSTAINVLFWRAFAVTRDLERKLG